MHTSKNGAKPDRIKGEMNCNSWRLQYPLFNNEQN